MLDNVKKKFANNKISSTSHDFGNSVHLDQKQSLTLKTVSTETWNKGFNQYFT